MIEFRLDTVGRVLQPGLLPGLLAGGAALAAVAWLAQAAVAPAPVLRAATSSGGQDTDMDGLPDALELRLGCNPNQPDSDGDGVGDAEEVARHSDPTDANSLPAPGGVAANLVVYQDGGPVHLVSVLYSADGNLTNKTLAMGARIGHRVRQAPVAYFTKNATFCSLQGKVSGSAVSVIDAPLDPTLLQRFPSISFFTTISENGKKVDAGVVDLGLKKNVPIEYFHAGSLAATLGRSPAPSSFYGPIDLGAVVELEWTPGEICGQVTAIAATMGPVVVEEIVDAACEPGWDSYCDSGCSATVGETIQRIDPIALING